MLILNDFRVLYIFIDESVKRKQVLNNYTNFIALQTNGIKGDYTAERLNVNFASAPSRTDLQFKHVWYLSVETHDTDFNFTYLFGMFGVL